MAAILQYVVYVASGHFLMLLIWPVITYGAGVHIWELPLVFLPCLLGGYASGLSFLFPRVAGFMGTIVGCVYLLDGISLYGKQPWPAFNVLAVAVILLLVSIFVLRNREETLWHRSRMPGRIALGIFAAIPAILATLWVLSVVSLLRYGLVGG